MNEFLEWLAYDQETGVFTWKKSPSSRVRAGACAGRVQSLGYLQIKLRGQLVYAHRLAWFFVTGKEPQFEIDHINGVRDDNRFANLRDVPRRINVQNLHTVKKKSGGLPGTSLNKKTGRWTARVVTDGKVTRVGPFDTEREAREAYVTEKRAQHEGCTL